MRRSRKSNKKNSKKYIIALFLILLILTVSIGTFAWIWSVHNRKEDKPVIDLSEISSLSEEETREKASLEESSGIESSEEESSKEEGTEQKINYPEPTYHFQTEEIVIEIPSISDAYTVAWVSDLHMVTDRQTAVDIKDEDVEAVKARYDFFMTADGVHGEDLLPEIIDFLNYGEYDGIIFGGDMLDYCSVSNMKLLTAEFGRLDKKVPILYIRADHDYGFWYGGDGFTEADAEAMHREMNDGDDLNTKYLDFGEFIILGINRSTKDMMPEQYSILDKMFADAKNAGKSVIVATHVPYASKIDETNDVSLYDKSMEVRNKIYYWGGGDYVANDVTRAFLDKIYSSDTQVNTVLAGHLHAGWDGMLTDQVRQHIFEPAYLGSIGIIKIVPKGE